MRKFTSSSPRKLNTEEIERLCKYGVSQRVVTMLESIGRRFPDHMKPRNQVIAAIIKMGARPTDAMLLFEEIFAGIHYGEAFFVDNNEPLYEERRLSNRVNGGYFGLLLGGAGVKGKKVRGPEFILHCGGLWLEHDRFYLSQDGHVHFGMYNKIAESMVPILELEAIHFACAVEFPRVHRYLFESSAAETVFAEIELLLPHSERFETGYAMARSNQCVAVLSRSWGEPDTEAEILIYVSPDHDQSAIITRIEAFPFEDHLVGTYSAEAGWH